MKLKWFKRIGWFYFPVSIPGAIAWFFGILFCLNVLRAVDRHSHSASDTLYGIFPCFTCVFLIMDWLGSRNSES